MWSKVNQFLGRAPVLLCPLCQRSGLPMTNGLCADCLALLPLNHNACEGCALPRAALSVSRLCPACLSAATKNTSCFCLFAYRFPVDALIQAIKFRENIALAHSLGRQLAGAIRTNALPMPQVIVPVPLHPRRLFFRGYNQALEIARPIAAILNLPIDSKTCSRIRHAAPQSTLPLRARAKNVQGVFHVEPGFPYQYVALVDDVITSMHTVSSLARAITASRHNNSVPVQISCWSLARAVFSP